MTLLLTGLAQVPKEVKIILFTKHLLCSYPILSYLIEHWTKNQNSFYSGRQTSGALMQ
jgi:hypothetical protein